MKHPCNEVLQDYFENILNPYQEGLVKEHLLNCDQCTYMLAQMTVIERKIKEQTQLAVPDTLKEKIFTDARAMLQLKKAQSQKQAMRKQRLEQFVRESRESIFAEIKIPILQACSVSMVLLTIIAFEKMNSESVTYKPINTQVEVMTFQEAEE